MSQRVEPKQSSIPVLSKLSSKTFKAKPVIVRPCNVKATQVDENFSKCPKCATLKSPFKPQISNRIVQTDSEEFSSKQTSIGVEWENSGEIIPVTFDKTNNFDTETLQSS